MQKFYARGIKMRKKLFFKDLRVDIILIVFLLFFFYMFGYMGRALYQKSKWTKMTFDMAYSIASSTGKYGFVASENEGDPVALRYQNMHDIYILVTRAGLARFGKGPDEYGNFVHIDMIDGSSIDFLEMDDDEVFIIFKNDEETYCVKPGSYLKYSELSKKCLPENNDPFLIVDMPDEDK